MKPRLLLLGGLCLACLPGACATPEGVQIPLAAQGDESGGVTGVEAEGSEGGATTTDEGSGGTKATSSQRRSTGGSAPETSTEEGGSSSAQATGGRLSTKTSSGVSSSKGGAKATGGAGAKATGGAGVKTTSRNATGGAKATAKTAAVGGTRAVSGTGGAGAATPGECDFSSKSCEAVCETLPTWELAPCQKLLVCLEAKSSCITKADPLCSKAGTYGNPTCTDLDSISTAASKTALTKYVTCVCGL